ncbi:molecular chaperone [Polaromonas sp.]|uniref:fimbrial biogenesis chaperone n=1 Tax=Polaromonas sp. TaxID=1869339 RepID=UPI003BB591D5
MLINPVLVELGTRQRVVAVTVSLSDTARAPMRLQANLLRWEQDVQGKAVTEPSDDLLVTPPIADLRPGDKQVFRVTLRGVRPAPEELAYRLILEDVAELTAAADSAPGMNIKFRMRYDLPVLVAPIGPLVNTLRWKPCPPEAALASANVASAPAKPTTARSPEACVRLLNAGNRRVKVQTLTLTGDNWQQALPLKDGVNVLAGAEREWRVPLQAGQTGALRGAQVNTARGETLQAEAGGF